MKILVVLQNMYDYSNMERKAPLLFRINPLNHSGKKLNKLIEDLFWVTNSSSILSGTGARSKTGIDKEYLQRALNYYQYDIIIVGGNQAKKAFNLCDYKGKANILFMPHPATRDMTNEFFDKLKIVVKVLKKVKRQTIFETIRLNGKYKLRLKIQ
jgi:hypothetical protein